MRDRLRFCPRVTRVPGDPELDAVLGHFGPERRPVLLDGAAGRPLRFALLGIDPVATARIGSLAELRPLVARLEPAGGDPDLPGAFHGGFLGALAYDLGVAGEGLTLPPEPWGFPKVVGGLYTDFLVRDHADRTWLVLGEEPGDGRPAVGERRERLLAQLERPPVLRPASAAGPLERSTSAAEHRARIARAQEAIAAGEMYQANVAHRMTRAVDGDPADLYRRLRLANPAPYMGFLSFEGGAVLSSSPELLLEFRPGELARTRPIKGTVERGATPEADEANARRLLASEKDRAELAMIVDLERNDLGRIAEVGSVRVGEFPRLETYAAVHHLVADVECRPRPEVDAVAALEALFPGGSITGAPKLRSMEIIADLEREGRGFFTGSLGLLDLRGRALFNILIRTLLWRPRDAGGGEVSFRVGGGITWASDPALEDAETLAKGRALAEALEGP
ncbi:MAG: anthranilate synthase component I family protein [Planctomycetota bacterium]